MDQSPKFARRTAADFSSHGHQHVRDAHIAMIAVVYSFAMMWVLALVEAIIDFAFVVDSQSLAHSVTRAASILITAAINIHC
jgi:hypothetical protein